MSSLTKATKNDTFKRQHYASDKCCIYTLVATQVFYIYNRSDPTLSALSRHFTSLLVF